MSFLSSLSVLLLCTNVRLGSSGRILIPGPPLGSRWVLVNKVATELTRVGHDVTMLEVLNGTHFDLVLSDFLSPCAVILARRLRAPVVFLARGTPGGYDLSAAGVPSPAAYVPQLGLALTDSMGFLQRLQNGLVQLVQHVLTGRLLLQPFDTIAKKHTGVPISDLLADTDLWLRHTDPIFETPRPRMHNMDLEDALAKVRGENMAVVTFGSMIDHFDADLAEVLSTALSRLPYKVVWR
uniref:Glucuronosyltransferase n=1 Tax=Branchiostoma floridae TaxID=7739 RepID=C3YNQ1_BRAFL|eukprot:XP_002601999.1 hypothetical protein BRAFLDRAFT_82585 [Branchiostoma floridae]